MKSDKQIRQDVLDELTWDPTINEKAIGVAVKDRIVTLAGFVDSYVQKLNAERAAARVSGVRALADELTVNLPSSQARKDSEIAQAAANALDWDIEIGDQNFKVKVEDGWVTLEGSAEWQYQKTAAERAVRYLSGVRGVRNNIAITPKQVSPFEVREKIKDALRRTADYEANQVTIETADGKVILRGKVRSFAERDDAERAAWSAPGVTAVEDRIIVGV
jgi:osmotically-inducible protein OsmY